MKRLLIALLALSLPRLTFASACAQCRSEAAQARQFGGTIPNCSRLCSSGGGTYQKGGSYYDQAYSDGGYTQTPQVLNHKSNAQINTEVAGAIVGGIGQLTQLFGMMAQSRAAYVPSGPAPLPTFRGGATRLPTPRQNSGQTKARQELEQMKKEPDYGAEETAKKLDEGYDNARWKEGEGQTVCRELGSGKEGEYSQEVCDTVFPEERTANRPAVNAKECTCSKWETANVGTRFERLACVDQKCPEPAPAVGEPKGSEPSGGDKGADVVGAGKGGSASGGGAKAKGDVAGAVGVVDAKYKRVEEKRAELAYLNIKLPELKETSKTWKGLEKDARAKVQAAKTPEEKKEKESALEEILAENRKTDAVTARFEKRREEAAREVKDGEKDLGAAAAQAREAIAAGKAGDFVDAHKDDAKGGSAAAPPADDKTGPCKDACKPAVKVWRPSSDSVDFVIEATRRYGDDSVPYAEAELSVFWAGGARDYTADLAGRVVLPPAYLKEHWPEKAERAEVKAELDGKSSALTVTRSELDHYVDAGAELLAAQGEEALSAGRADEAAEKFWKSLSWKASDKAADGWTRAMERRGGGDRKILAAYRTALLGKVMEPKSRYDFKLKAIRLAGGLKPKPGVSQEALAYWKKGIDTFKTLDLAKSMAEEETASSLAPWWAEPYYAMALVYEQMAVHKSFAYASAAVESYDLFLAAAERNDKRLERARSERDRFKRLIAAME